MCRGVFVTGNTSTTSGLTVTLSRDQSSDCAIEAGALVLADQVGLLTISLSMVGTVPNGLMTVHIFLISSHILACLGCFKYYFQREGVLYFSRKHWFSGLSVFILQIKCRETCLYRTVRCRHGTAPVPVPSFRAILEGLRGLSLNFKGHKMSPIFSYLWYLRYRTFHS